MYNALRRFRKSKGDVLERLRDEVEQATGGVVVSVLPCKSYVDVTVRIKQKGGC